LKKILLTLVFSVILISSINYAFAQYVADPLVVLETNQGEIIIEFFHLDAANHVENFILLSKTGYYDGILFHRIIPGFMIQSGDPNTIDGDPNTWGQGGGGALSDRIDAEFNSIKHNRGIVSMARSADPNSAGSQFFIVHANSNFLDEDYTVFGRIITEESFETLDKIATVQTGTNDRPINPEQVKIIKATIVDRSEISDILQLSEPERTESAITPSTGKQIFESKELDISFSAPEGWLLQQPENIPGAPNVAVVGPKVDGVNPVISLTIQNVGEKTLDDLIKEKNDSLAESIYLNKLKILSQEKIKTNVHQINAIGNFERNDEQLKIKFLEVLILSEQKSYTFAYSNTIENYDNEVSKFQESLNSFKILSQEDTITQSTTETSTEEGGGCLIATATYGSELAPQVQQLRELRDNQLLQTESGTAFMGTFNDIYYSFSPIIADYERENPYFKEAVKLAITPMISSLSLMENANSESEVLSIGISIITLNLGMYLGVPAVVVIGIRKKF
jgi:peptidyl-prolyl cis-trans isomerase B (cyclophilin B)